MKTNPRASPTWILLRKPFGQEAFARVLADRFLRHLSGVRGGVAAPVGASLIRIVSVRVTRQHICAVPSEAESPNFLGQIQANSPHSGQFCLFANFSLWWFKFEQFSPYFGQ